MAYSKKSLGRTIIRLRQKSSFSQEELADRAGVHRTYISQLERGIKSPTVFILADIAEALNVKLSDLFILMESTND